MSFEKQIKPGSPIVVPMSCNCGTVYDPAKSESKWTNDQKHNSGTCEVKA